MKPTLRRATISDVAAIHALLCANRTDPSLFQQTKAQIRADIDSFRVATIDDEVVASAALVVRGRQQAEILGVAVAPHIHGRGLGTAVIAYVIETARAEGVDMVWLGTAKPGYFARFGFAPMSRWRLPLLLLLHKLRLVFSQPRRRWLPAIFGRHVFMRLVKEKAPHPTSCQEGGECMG